jgi:hypothetical protein
VKTLIKLFIVFLTLAASAFTYLLVRGYIVQTETASVESSVWEQNPEAVISLPINAQKLLALVQLRNLEYIEFAIDKSAKHNYIEERYLADLKPKNSDIDYFLEKDNGTLKLRKSVLIPRLILKDSEKKDFIVKNLRFLIVKEGNLFNTEFLDLLDYKLSLKENLLSVKLYPDEAAVLADTETDETKKNYQLYAMRLIRKNWREATKQMPYEVLKDLSIQKNSGPINNDIEIELDSHYGYILKVTLLKASESKSFNEFTKQFFTGLDRLRNIPPSMQNTGKTFTLNINLEYFAG